MGSASSYPAIPYGRVNFKGIRQEGALYVDKTRFLHDIEAPLRLLHPSPALRGRTGGCPCWRATTGFPLAELALRENFLSLMHCFGLLSIQEADGGIARLASPTRPCASCSTSTCLRRESTP